MVPDLWGGGWLGGGGATGVVAPAGYRLSEVRKGW